jgi:hypothetical protein
VRGCGLGFVRASDPFEFGHDRGNCVGHGGGDRIRESGAWASVGSLNGKDHYLPWQPFQDPAEPYRVRDAEPVRAGRGAADFQLASGKPVDAPWRSRHPLDGRRPPQQGRRHPTPPAARRRLTIANDDTHAREPLPLDLGRYFRSYPVVAPERIPDSDDYGFGGYVRHTVRVRK